MPLMHKDSDRLDVVVKYAETANGLEFFEDNYDKECLKETFNFKRLTWEMHKGIMSAVMVMNVQGQSLVDLFKLMDLKVKTQIAEWSLKDDKGDNLPVTPENIGRLDPLLIQHLFSKLQAIDKTPIT